MKIALRLPRIAVLVTALSFATVALAQPPPPGPPGAPGAPGDPRLPKKRRHGLAIRVVPPGPGPRGVPPPLVPPPPPPRYSHYSSRTYRVTRSSDSTLSSVQSALKTRGYYTGSVDGVSGPATRGAITGFRGDNGLGTSTGIDSTLLRALGL